MEEQHIPDFIVIDDDYINNVICQLIIQNELKATKIIFFTVPQKGLEYIEATYSGPEANDAVLFLDINMPVLNAWDVLDQLKNSSEWVKHHLRIFIFSSSLSHQDKQRAADNPLVSGYIEKPLKPIDLQNILGNRPSGQTPVPFLFYT
ncbi:MAG TPA: response regulator [Chitinophagaceae bacterium]|nr:response regulator [Chitinophagaceae bacterium]